MKELKLGQCLKVTDTSSITGDSSGVNHWPFSDSKKKREEQNSIQNLSLKDSTIKTSSKSEAAKLLCH